MGEKSWYKPVVFTFVVLSLVLVAIGMSLTEPGTEELAYGTSGSFYIEDSHADMAIIVFTDNEDVNCEAFDLTVDRRDGSYDFVPVEKTNCDRWSLPNSYQFRLYDLTEERYGFSATDTVTIVAVEGDLDAYMEDYASGNSIADIGTSMCCISILLHVFVGRGIAKANKAEHQVTVGSTFTSPTVASTPYFEQFGHQPEQAPSSEHAPTKQTPTEESLEKEVRSTGAFWGGIKDD